tara:strand:- start:17235 stop:18068 length:834 start_codon:yes stop_codon:yes gene_type:complete
VSLLSNFKAPEGHMFIDFDYAQLEVRVLALATEDVNLIDDINSGRDMHTFFASKIFDAPESAITKEQRKMAKGFSFQLQYGAGARSIAEHWDVDEELARRFLDEYYDRYAGVRSWQQTLMSRADESLVYAGDIDPETNESIPCCSIPSIWKDKNTGAPVTYYRVLAMKAKYSKTNDYIAPPTKVKNYPIQGAASDIVTMMLHRLHKQSKHLTLLNTVHDSFLALVKIKNLEAGIDEGKAILSSVPKVLKNSFMVNTPVPFPVDFTYGDTLEKVKQKG